MRHWPAFMGNEQGSASNAVFTFSLTGSMLRVCLLTSLPNQLKGDDESMLCSQICLCISQLVKINFVIVGLINKQLHSW